MAFTIKVHEYPQMSDEKMNAWCKEFIQHLKNDISNEDFVQFTKALIDKKVKEVEQLQAEIASLQKVYEGLIKLNPKGNIISGTNN